MKSKEFFPKVKQFVLDRAANTSLKHKVLLGCFVAGAVALASTNPKKEAYLAYASSHLPARAEKACDKYGQGIDIQLLIFRLPASGTCKSFVHGSDKVLRPFSMWAISRNTNSPINLVLFTVYTTDFDLPGTRPFRTVGIGNQFIGLPW